jgi:hypothetical protein
MEPTKPRRRGRPPGMTTKPPDLNSEIWIQVLIARVKGRQRTGKTPSVRKACEEIIENGGVISAIGGDREALVAENAARKKSLQRFKVSSDAATFGPAADGNIFATHTISHAGTLHARYSEVAKFASSPQVRWFWMNLARQRLGIPQKKRPRPHLGRG